MRIEARWRQFLTETWELQISTELIKTNSTETKPFDHVSQPVNLRFTPSWQEPTHSPPSHESAHPPRMSRGRGTGVIRQDRGHHLGHPGGLHPPHSTGYSRRATFRHASASDKPELVCSHSMRSPHLNGGWLPHNVSEWAAGAYVLRTASVHVSVPQGGGGGGGAAPKRVTGEG